MRAPERGLLPFMKGLRSKGFLDNLGEQWKTHVDGLPAVISARS